MAPLAAMMFMAVFSDGLASLHPSDEGWLGRLVAEAAFALQTREVIKAAKRFV